MWGLATTTDKKLEQRADTARLLAMIGLSALGAGAVFMVLSQSNGFTAAVGVCGVVFTAGAASGGFLGFLFSVPRILARGEVTPTPQAGGGVPLTAPETIARRERLLSSNTNLERISEWLTTMLVGVGLSQIGILPQKMRVFSDFLATKALVFQSADGSLSAGVLPAIGPFVLISGVVTGFLFFYLYTRIYLSPLFQYVEEGFLDWGNEILVAQTSEAKFSAQTLVDEGDANLSVRSAAGSDQMTVNQALSVISSLLYQPGKYEEAIRIGTSLVNTPLARTAQFWLLMAAAYGQRHRALRRKDQPDYVFSEADKSELAKARQDVLSAAREAVSRDSSYKGHLYRLTNAKSHDNDLRDFASDPDFLKIVQ